MEEEATLRADLYSKNDVANKVRKMIFTHFKYDSSRDPLYYLPEKYREEYSQEFEVQKAEIESLGRNAYLNEKVDEGRISRYFADAIISLDPIVAKVSDGKYELAIDDLILNRPNPEIPSSDAIIIISLYDLIIQAIQDTIDNEDQASTRAPCSLAEFIGDVIDGVGIEGSIGGAAAGVIAFLSGGVGAGIPIAGSVIGGIVAGVISLFSDGNCDCGAATSIIVVDINGGSDPCNPELRLRALGAGDDAELFNWTVNEGNTNGFFPAEPATLSVPPTQNSPDVSLRVTTRTLCPNDLDDIDANVLSAREINLFDALDQIEEVGEILVFGELQQQSDGTIEISNSGLAQIIRPSSTNGGTLRNTFSVEFDSSCCFSSSTGQDEIRLFISGNVGDEGSFTVIGTNICSGATSELELNYVIVP